MSCGGDNFIVPGANPCNNGGGGGVAGVTSLNGFQNNVSITAADASIGVSNQGGNIVLSASGLQAVNSLNGLSGSLNIINGTNTSVIVNGTDISINVPTIVNSVNTVVGSLTLTGTGATTVSNVGTAFTVNTPISVNSLNTRTGALTIAGANDTSVTNIGNAFTVSTTVPVKTLLQGSGIALTNNGSGSFTIATTPRSLPTADTQWIPAPVALLPAVENIAFTFTTPSFTTAGSFVLNAMITIQSLTATPYVITTYYKKNGTRIQPSDTKTTVAGSNWFYTIPMVGGSSIPTAGSATFTLCVTISGGAGTEQLYAGQMTYSFYPTA